MQLADFAGLEAVAQASGEEGRAVASTIGGSTLDSAASRQEKRLLLRLAGCDGVGPRGPGLK